MESLGPQEEQTAGARTKTREGEGRYRHTDGGTGQGNTGRDKTKKPGGRENGEKIEHCALDGNSNMGARLT